MSDTTAASGVYVAGPSLIASNATTGITWGVTSSDSWAVQLGSGSLMSVEAKVDQKAEKKHLSIQLYFNFVKSKFTKLERQKIMEAMRRYQALQFEAKSLGQTGLYEELTKSLLLAAREQQCAVCGFERVVLRDDVMRYINKVDGKVVLEPFESFPRPVPAKPAASIRHARERKLFDSYEVLYHPMPKEEALKSTAQKIAKKDPIVFGVFKHNPERLYPVADWIDEHCDLTMTKLISGLKTLERDYLPGKIKEPTKVDIEALKREVEARATRLQVTNVSNWRQQEADERASFSARHRVWHSLRRLFGRAGK